MPASTQNAIIPAGGFLSSVINATNANTGITRIIHPAGWTNRAWCTALMSYDGATFNDLFYGNGQPVIIHIIPGGTTLVDEQIYQQLAYFKLRSGSAQYPIAQTEERVFTIVLE